MSIYNGDIIGFDACSGIPGSTDDDANYHISRVINDREQISADCNKGGKIIFKAETRYKRIVQYIFTSYTSYDVKTIHMLYGV